MTNPQEAKAAPAQRLAHWAIAAVSLALGFRLFWILRRYAVNTLYWDQWDFLDGFFSGADLWTLFRWQHGPHREGLGALGYAILLPFSHWSNRVEALVAGGALVLAGLLALGIKRWIFGSLEAADAAFPLLFLSALPSELFFGAQNLAHGPFAVLLVFAVAASLLIRPIAIRIPVLLVLNFLAIYTGFALISGALVPILFAIEAWKGRDPRDRRWLLGGLALSLASLAFFFVNYVVYPSPRADLYSHSKFPILVFGRALGFYGHEFGKNPMQLKLQALLSLVSVAFLVLTGAVALRKALRGREREGGDESDRIVAVVLYLSGFSMAFLVMASLGRTFLGAGAALASRYVVYSYPAVVAAYLAASAWIRHASLRRVAIGLLLANLLAREVRTRAEEGTFEWIRIKKTEWVACYLEVEDVKSCDERFGFPTHPDRERARIAEKLAYLKANRLSFFRR